MPTPLTIWCIKATLSCLITKPLSQPMWLVGTKVAAEDHQNKKLDQRGNISICHRISQYFSTAENVVIIATKKNLTEKHSWNALSVFYVFVPCKRTKLFCKTLSFLAYWKRCIFIVVFSSCSIVKVLTKQNKHAKLWNYAFQWKLQKKSPEMFCKKGVLKNFTTFKEKHWCSLNKTNDSNQKCFSWA